MITQSKPSLLRFAAFGALTVLVCRIAAGQQAPTGASSKWACFGSFESSALAAFFSSFLVTYTTSSGVTLDHASEGFILADQLSHGASLATVFQQIGTGNGPLGGWDPGNQNYGSAAATTIKYVPGLASLSG